MTTTDAERPMRNDAERPMRKDVARNRALLLAAAEEVMARKGLETTLDDVAKHAGLGVGTAYRHFASKKALLTAMLDQRLEKVYAAAVLAESEPDPGTAFYGFLITLASMQAADRGLREALSSAKDEPAIDAVRARVQPVVDRLVERAHASGQLRPDITTMDLPVITAIIGALTDHIGDQAPDLWRRYLDLILDGMRGDAEPRRPLSAGPPDDAVVEAMIRTHSRVNDAKSAS